MLLVTAGTAHADVPYITATAEYITADTIVISGTLHGASDDMISLVFGDINTILHIDQTDIVNGEFVFKLALSEHVPAYEHTYILSTASAQFRGKLKTRGHGYTVTDTVLTADMDFSIKNYVPTFSGTASCVPGQNLSVLIKDITSGVEIVADTFNAQDGQYSFSYTLSKLTSMHEYTIFLSSKNGNNTTVSADLSVTTSPLAASFNGPIYAAPNYSLNVRLRSVNTNLIDKTMNFTNRTWDTKFTLPNLLSNCDFKVDIDVNAVESSHTDGSVRYLQNPSLYNALKNKFPHFDSANVGTITIEELNSIKGILDLSNCNLISLEGMQNCTGVTHLYLANNSINDISPLLTLNNLLYLDASGNTLTYIYRIPPYLKYLDLSGNDIQDIHALSFSDTIVQLDVSDNRIADVRPITNYKFLRYLDIKNNNITDITALPKKKYAKLITEGHNITNR